MGKDDKERVRSTGKLLKSLREIVNEKMDLIKNQEYYNEIALSLEEIEEKIDESKH